MFAIDSSFYGLAVLSLVFLCSLVIRTKFNNNIYLKHHRIKPLGQDKNLRAYFNESRPIYLTIALIVFLGWAFWQGYVITQGYAIHLRPFYVGAGILFIVQLILAMTLKPYRERTIHQLKHKFKTAILLPVYNEDERSLRAGLESFFYQTIRPNEVHVVDDGSSATKYISTKKWFLAEALNYNIIATWTRQENKGKRSAHLKALENLLDPENTIIITIDSDGVLDPHAIEEGLKPFHDPLVKSVAGLVIAKNAQKNLLSRITDLLFVSSQQLIDRSAMSQLESVLVNSGGLAFYKFEVVKEAIDNGYDNEKFFGRKIHFSDDSFLTLFALLKGAAVQQPTSIVFADMPADLSHHFRQQLRWNRGSFIRSWWRLRHLPVTSVGFLRQILGYLSFFSLTVIFIQILILIPIFEHKFPSYQIFLVPIIFGYLQASRYFTVKRSDMSNWSQFFTFLLSPVAVIWNIIALRALRIYAFVTCLNTGWGTRQKIEINNSDTGYELAS